MLGIEIIQSVYQMRNLSNYSLTITNFFNASHVLLFVPNKHWQ